MQLVLDTQGMALKVKNKCFYLAHGEERRQISPVRVSSILITKNISLSSAALRLAALHGIPVLITDATGQAGVRMEAPLFGNLPLIRRRQVWAAHHPVSVQWIADMLTLKLKGQAANLAYLINRRPNNEVSLRTAMQKIEQSTVAILATDAPAGANMLPAQQALASAEATAAMHYWPAVSSALPPPYPFAARSRQPARDLFNAALNYLYGMLYNVAETALLTAGLDPALGFLHSDGYATPSLAFDMIEAFRPQTDYLLIGWCLQGQLLPYHAEVKENNGTWISRQGKQFIIPAFNAWMMERCTFNGRNTARKNHLLATAGDLVKRLKNTFGDEPYIPGNV